MNKTYNKRFYSSQKHDYSIEIENFDIDKVSFYIGKNFSYHKINVQYQYDDGKIRDFQLKTHYHQISANRSTFVNEPIINIRTEHAVHLNNLLDNINTKFSEYCLSDKNKDHLGNIELNANGFVKSITNMKIFRIKIDDNTRLINYNLSKKYGLVEEIPQNTTEEKIKTLRKIIPRADYDTNYDPDEYMDDAVRRYYDVNYKMRRENQKINNEKKPKKEAMFILKPYIGCVKQTMTVAGSVTKVQSFGMLVAHTAEIKYMDANIKSVVDYKVCEPKKMPKHEHITVTI
jgi:hypothetical protein